MSTDLWCLVANALWGVVLVQAEVIGKTKAAGKEWNIGNRDTEPEWPAWVKRSAKALANHKENFPVFLTAVLVVHLSGAADRTSAIACIVYVIARAVHGLLYIGGVTKVRSVAFLVGAASVLVLLTRLRLG
ncbi:MAG: MAPEG family protein [Labilithrix sp.]